MDPDRYSITRVLGEGGMGEVRQCQDSLLDRSVALKAVKPEATSRSDFEERFLREARVQARLAHPGVVPVYDLGRDDNGRVYFTMKRVEGVTIEDVILAHRAGRAAPYDRRQLLTAFARACLTVDFAHSRGVLHRDLKPANLMLGAFGEVYVLDWGLAKMADMDDLSPGEVTLAERGKQTEVGVAMGTPAYMSPEQATAEPLDARSDVFALGAILYEILTSEPLLDDHAIRSIRQRLRLQVHPRTGVEELDAICFKATAFDPDHRYPTARALHDAVDAFLSADEEGRRRRRLAAVHIERAKAYDTDELRPAALEALGKALALDPDDEAARSHLVDLLRHPPKVAPAEVTERRLQGELARLRRLQGTVALIYFAAWLVCYPALVVAGGVRDLASAIVAPAAWALCASVIGAQYLTKRRPHLAITPFFSALAVAATSAVWGPIFIVPGLAIVIVFGHLLVGPRQHRELTVGLVLAAVAVPSGLAMRGILHVYTPIGVDSFLVDGAIGVTRPVFYFGVVGAHLLQVFFGARFAGRYRDTLDQRVLENTLLSWQLANLVPRSVATSFADRRSRLSLLASDELSISLAANDALVHDASHALVVDADAPDHLRYQKVAHIGSTACTEVWRCLDRRLGREVDMHVSRSAADDVATLAQARACGRIEHPMSAPVYDVGADAHGRVYYTIKNLRGVTLDVAVGSLPDEHAFRRLLATFGQVCLAIAYAHERRVYHRGLRPQQIMLGSFGEVYVTGWSATPFESIHDAAVDTRALRKMLEELADRHHVAIAGLPFVKSPRDIHEAIEAFLAGSRDEEVRAELAAAHLERANAAAARAFAKNASFEAEAEARVAALREVGRAVRLEPGDEGAVRLLFKLMTEPPKHPPPAVLREIERLRDERARGPARSSAMFGAAWLAAYPVIAFLLGVKRPTSVLVIWTVWAIAVAVVVHCFVRRSSSSIPWLMLATMFAGLVTAVLVGPFFFTPVIATFATVAFVVTVPPGWRRTTTSLGLLLVLVPAGLGATRIHPAGDVIANIVTSSGALGSPSHETTLLVLTAMHLVSVLFAAEYAARFRDRLDVVEQAYLLRTWQLTKLVRG